MAYIGTPAPLIFPRTMAQESLTSGQSTWQLVLGTLGLIPVLATFSLSSNFYLAFSETTQHHLKKKLSHLTPNGILTPRTR